MAQVHFVVESWVKKGFEHGVCHGASTELNSFLPMLIAFVMIVVSGSMLKPTGRPNTDSSQSPSALERLCRRCGKWLEAFLLVVTR